MSTWDTEDESENIDEQAESQPRLCALCNKNNVPGGFRVCTECYNQLTSEPKVHLRLEDSATQPSGVVMWDHNSIGAEPHDKNPIAIGIWGKYNLPPNETFWVSLCKPVEAIHDMMTQFYLNIREDNRKTVASYSSGTAPNAFKPSKKRYESKEREEKRAVQPGSMQPEPQKDTSAEFGSLRDRLMKPKGGS